MGSDSHIDNFLLSVHHYKSNRLPAFFAPAFRGTKLENRVVSLHPAGAFAGAFFRMLSKHERYYALGMDALVIVCSRNTNVTMVWAWML